MKSVDSSLRKTFDSEITNLILQYHVPFSIKLTLQHISLSWIMKYAWNIIKLYIFKKYIATNSINIGKLSNTRSKTE